MSRSLNDVNVGQIPVLRLPVSVLCRGPPGGVGPPVPTLYRDPPGEVRDSGVQETTLSFQDGDTQRSDSPTTREFR